MVLSAWVVVVSTLMLLDLAGDENFHLLVKWLFPLGFLLRGDEPGLQARIWKAQDGASIGLSAVTHVKGPYVLWHAGNSGDPLAPGTLLAREDGRQQGVGDRAMRCPWWSFFWGSAVGLSQPTLPCDL